ncbi:MAG: formylglycine-generating enzyme family protein [Magnetococcales bacterium]|nr:formylglycine-generating enzyme family protein [Magnetococcales bacterium]
MKGFMFRLGLGMMVGWWSFIPAQGEAYLINEWERLALAGGERPLDEEPVPGKNWTDALTGIEFVWIAGGCFQMGSPPWKDGREHDEGPLHQVCLGDYWLAQREVTQGQWQAIMRMNPSAFPKGDAYPLERVTWLDAEVIAANLNERYRGKARIRLPTEAEWEYACRERGDDIVYAGRDDVHRVSWNRENSLGSTQMTGTRQPNRLGLLDMSGNVWEWTQDSYRPDAYSRHNENNPGGVDEGFFKVIRGGGWKDASGALRCANRGFERYLSKRHDLGFRLAAVVDVASVDGKRPPLFEIPF